MAGVLCGGLTTGGALLGDEPHDRSPAVPRGDLSDRSPTAREAVAATVRLWWLRVLRGCLALLLGVGALITGASQPVLGNYIGGDWLVCGMLASRWAVAHSLTPTNNGCFNFP